MKKLKTLLTTALCLCAVCALALPASALEYNINAPGDPEYGKPTSFEPVVTADGGAMKNEDVSKNAALIPPGFGTPTSSAQAAYLSLPATAESSLIPLRLLSPQSLGDGFAGAPWKPSEAGSMGEGGARERTQFSPQAGTEWSGLCDDVVTPPASGGVPGSMGSYPITDTSTSPSTSAGFTEVTSELYYSHGSLGTLNIPSIGLTVKVFEGTGSAPLLKGAGHFEGTSIWDGNVPVAGHNRGVRDDFGRIHTLRPGDTVTFTTKLGTRTYAVTGVAKVSVNDVSGLEPTSVNMVTLYTCVNDQPAYRWCVTAREV